MSATGGKPSSKRKLFQDDKWLWIPGIIIAIIVASIIRGQRAQEQKTPTAEPQITVYMHETGEQKSMPLETYLQGVVAAEMSPDWPLAALEAQAIVARTFTVKKMEQGPLQERGTDASTDPKEFQAYNEERINDRVIQAVNNTRGQIITYGGKPIMAWFHASSGGKTATAMEGLGYSGESTPYIAPIADVQAEPSHNWHYSFSMQEFQNGLRAQGIDISTLNNVGIGRKGPSGRAETLKVNDKEVSAPSLRLALGPEKMRSTLLDSVSLEGGNIVMRGRGYGHGVGMSQWGAWLMAQRGKTSHDIVNYYFKGVRITNAWE
jgi:stage II sporulation protein D